jgi:hypothetical protein
MIGGDAMAAEDVTVVCYVRLSDELRVAPGVAWRESSTVQNLYCAVRSAPPARCEACRHRCVSTSGADVHRWFNAKSALLDRLRTLEARYRLADDVRRGGPRYQPVGPADEWRWDPWRARYRQRRPKRRAGPLSRLFTARRRRDEFAATVERLQQDAATAFREYRKNAGDLTDRINAAHARVRAGQIREQHERWQRERDVIAQSVGAPVWACRRGYDFVIFQPTLDDEHVHALTGRTPQQVNGELERWQAQDPGQRGSLSFGPNTGRALANWYLKSLSGSEWFGLSWSAWLEMTRQSIGDQPPGPGPAAPTYHSPSTTDFGSMAWPAI